MILPHVVAIIDGSTSSPPLGGVPGGVLAADAIAQSLQALSPGWAFRELVDKATEAFGRRLNSHELLPAARPSASLLAWSPDRDELYRLGDSHAVLDGRALIGDK